MTEQTHLKKSLINLEITNNVLSLYLKTYLTDSNKSHFCYWIVTHFNCKVGFLFVYQEVKRGYIKTSHILIEMKQSETNI